VLSVFVADRSFPALLINRWFGLALIKTSTEF